MTAVDRTLVAPLAAEIPYTFQGKLGRCWGGDEFEVRQSRVLHYIILQGIDGPEPGQPYFDAAGKAMRQLIRKAVDVRVVYRDDCQCEYAYIDFEGQDLGLRLIESGLGWYDQTECEKKDVYLAAQKKAQQEKIGLWADENPVPPWKFRDAVRSNFRADLKSKIED